MASSLPSASAPFQGSVYDDLGVTLGPDGGTLRVWSGAASSVELVIFDDTDLDWITAVVQLDPVGGGRCQRSQLRFWSWWVPTTSSGTSSS